MHVFLAILGVVLLWTTDFARALLVSLVPRRFRRRKDVTAQTILITGAGSGLGRQMAVEFSRLKVCLVLLDIDRSSLEETQRLLDARSKAALYQCDVTLPDQVYEVAGRVKKEVGAVDILVNNAGVVSGKSLLEIPDEMIRRTMEVNVMAHFWMCKAYLPAMMAANRGHVVSITSIAGKIPGPRLTDYCASKYAAIGLAESLEMELRDLGKDDIKVTVVCPSITSTGLFDGFKIRALPTLTPEYVARKVVQGVLEEKETISIPSWAKLLYIVREISPRWLTIWFSEKTGDIKGMRAFKGRPEKTENMSPRSERLTQ